VSLEHVGRVQLNKWHIGAMDCSWVSQCTSVRSSTGCLLLPAGAQANTQIKLLENRLEKEYHTHSGANTYNFNLRVQARRARRCLLLRSTQNDTC